VSNYRVSRPSRQVIFVTTDLRGQSTA